MQVGNKLGAGKPRWARTAATVALWCAVVVGAAHMCWTVALQWVRLFTREPSVVALASAAMPILGLCELGNCSQTTGCGVLRRTARPVVGARINLPSFYLVGKPIAVALAFGPARAGFGGLWYGLLSAQAACVALVLVAVLCSTDCTALRAKKLTAVTPATIAGLEIATVTTTEETMRLLVVGNRRGEVDDNDVV